MEHWPTKVSRPRFKLLHHHPLVRVNHIVKLMPSRALVRSLAKIPPFIPYPFHREAEAFLRASLMQRTRECNPCTSCRVSYKGRRCRRSDAATTSYRNTLLHRSLSFFFNSRLPGLRKKPFVYPRRRRRSRNRNRSRSGSSFYSFCVVSPSGECYLEKSERCIYIRIPRATYVVNRRRRREKRYPVEEEPRWMPRTPTLMSSARLLVVRRAFLVLDARWTMAKKTLSLSLSLYASLSVYSISPALSFYRQVSSFGQPLSGLLPLSCLLAFVMTREVRGVE